MSKIISYSGQTSCTPAKVVEFPALIKSGQKPIRYWADGGLIYCIDPNKPDGKPSWGQPLDILRRVAMTIKLFVADMRKTPGDYHVTEQVLWNFFNRFKQEVFDEALLQDEKGGNVIENTNKAWAQTKKELGQELLVEASKRPVKSLRVRHAVSRARPSQSVCLSWLTLS